VRIITEKRLKDWEKTHPKATRYLEAWRKNVRLAAWRNLVEVRRTYPGTDSVKMPSGRQVQIFNVCGNDYRLIVAVHSNRNPKVYILRFLTHAEYSKDRWKAEL
jgi:mRNA-degrading endonuclease HigB of HigAB toxin-antitoxin module